MSRLVDYRVDPERGFLYGRFGRPIRKTCKGYVQIKSWLGRAKAVHIIIWESVHGAIPDGMQINHINGIKNDNRIANLELVTPSGNTKHAYLLGLSSAQGECNGRAKLNADNVADIRASRESQRTLAEKYGVARRTIRDVLSGKSWASIANGGTQ